MTCNQEEKKIIQLVDKTKKTVLVKRIFFINTRTKYGETDGGDMSFSTLLSYGTTAGKGIT